MIDRRRFIAATGGAMLAAAVAPLAAYRASVRGDFPPAGPDGTTLDDIVRHAEHDLLMVGADVCYHEDARFYLCGGDRDYTVFASLYREPGYEGDDWPGALGVVWTAPSPPALYMPDNTVRTVVGPVTMRNWNTMIAMLSGHRHAAEILRDPFAFRGRGVRGPVGDPGPRGTVGLPGVP